jgi:hypothetical protein
VAVWGRDRGREMVLACSGDAASHMMRTRGGVIKNSIGRSVYIYIYICIFILESGISCQVHSRLLEYASAYANDLWTVI